jgi:hypothetical protein
MTERLLFVDPIAIGAGDDVDDARAPWWFVVVAVFVLGVAAYYLGSFWGGPRDSSPHRFQPGREVYEQVAQTSS